MTTIAEDRRTVNDVVKPARVDDEDSAPVPAALTTDEIAARMIPEPVLERLVYFSGSPRGGTTIISRSFCLSDRVFTFPAFTQFTHNVWKHRNKVDTRLLRRIFRIPNFYREPTVLKLLDEQTRGKFEREIQDALRSKHLGRMYKNYARIYALDPRCEKDGARALCWADKATDVTGVFDIARAMPQAKFIFVIRDPRAAIASMQGQLVMSRDEKTSPAARRAALISSAIYWRHLMQTYLRVARRYPDRVAFVRYEDFVADPAETINRLLEFGCGERMQEDALNAGLVEFKHGRKHDRSTSGAGIDRRPLERWRRMLNDEELALLSSLTWRTARKLGYDIGRWSPLPALKAVTKLRGARNQATTIAKLSVLTGREFTLSPRAS